MSRRFLYILFPLFILISALMYIVIHLDHERSFTTTVENERNVLTLAERVISNEMSTILGDLTYISRQANIQQLFVAHTETPRKELEHDFQQFLGTKKIYQQIRIIDNHGRERLRVDFRGGRTLVTPQDELQDKTERYYVSEGLALNENDVYVSPLDLNVEFGEIEVPFNPTMRFVMPLFQAGTGKRLGLIVLNYFGDRLLAKINALNDSAGRSIWLVNKDGFFLSGESSNENWGFMLEDRQAFTLENKNPALWKAINNAPGKKFLTSDDFLFSFTHICDNGSCPSKTAENEQGLIRLPFKGSDFPWLVISRLNLSTALANKGNERWFWLYGLMLILTAITVLSGYATWKMINTVSSLKKAKNEISEKEQLVETFIKNNPALAYLKNKDGRYQLVNQAYAAFLGKDVEDVIGKTDFDIKDDMMDFSQRLTAEQATLHRSAPSMTNESWLDHLGVQKNYIVTRFPIPASLPGNHLLGVIAIDVTERDTALAESAEKQAMFTALVNSSPNAILIVDDQAKVIFCNKQSEHLFGWREDELVGMKIEQLVPEDVRSSHIGMRKAFIDEATLEATSLDHAVPGLTKDGTLIDLEITLSPLNIKRKKHTVCIIRDISERLKLENHLRQSQKMDAIGHLSGGIAHDFNNLLGIIIGNLDMLSSRFQDDEKAHKRINTALKAALSGAELTKRLLAFARKQSLQPEAVDIKATLTEMMPILERTLKSDIEVKLLPAPDMDSALVDRSELENVILNMAINARDAMPEGGQLTLELEQIYLDGAFIEHQAENLDAGDYIHLTISDNGAGIPKETLRHIFEPFFTTKEKGKGTGLGLSMAHGFVKQSKGIIKVYSEIDIGTSFHIYLPAIKQHDENTRQPGKIADNITGSERILVVDDEEDLGEVASAYLSGLGYSVERASSAEQALDLLAADNQFDLVITDIVMPGGMGGIDLYEAVHALYPQIRFIYASGYSAEALQSKRGTSLDARLVNKPFRKSALAKVVREVLDSN